MNTRRLLACTTLTLFCSFVSIGPGRITEACDRCGSTACDQCAVSCNSCDSSGCSSCDRGGILDHTADIFKRFHARTKELLKRPAKSGCDSQCDGGCNCPTPAEPTCRATLCDATPYTTCDSPTCDAAPMLQAGPACESFGSGCEPLLKRLFAPKTSRCGVLTTCGWTNPNLACDVSGYVPPAAPVYAPSCGCESQSSTCTSCSQSKSGHGLLTNLFKKHSASSCDCDAPAPSCGCETTAPSCGVEASCGSKPKVGLLNKLFQKHKQPSCGCENVTPDCGCEAAPSCSCETAAPSCGCETSVSCEPSCGAEQKKCLGGSSLFERLFTKKAKGPGCGCEIEATCGAEQSPCACNTCQTPASVPNVVPQYAEPAPTQQLKDPVYQAPAQPMDMDSPVPAPQPPTRQRDAVPPPARVPDAQIDPFMDDAVNRVRRVPAKTIQYQMPATSTQERSQPSYGEAYDPQASNGPVRMRFSDWSSEVEIRPASHTTTGQLHSVVPASATQLRPVPRLDTETSSRTTRTRQSASGARGGYRRW